jgi:hypothetical protein
MGWIRDPGKTYSRGQKSVSLEAFMINAKALNLII